MAIILCRECKKEVSDIAKTCPHCGTLSPNQTFQQIDLQNKNKKYLKSLKSWLVVVIGSLLLIASDNNDGNMPFILFGFGIFIFAYYLIVYIISLRKLNKSLQK